MKKFIISVAVLLASLSATVSCSFFQLDSFEGPNAEVTGNLIDMVTGEKMSIEAAQSQGFDWSTWSMVTTVSYGALTVYEQGYVPPTWGGAPEDYPGRDSGQYWMVRFDGQFTNTRVFAATYKYSTQKMLPCYDPEPGKDTFVLKEGKNRMDIGVLPFCRVKDPKIEYNAATKKLVATFYVELGDPNRANKVSNVAFGGKVHYNIRMLLLKQIIHGYPVADILFYKAETAVIQHRFQRGKISRIRQLVQTDHTVFRMGSHVIEDIIGTDKPGSSGNDEGHSCVLPISCYIK